MTKINKTNNKEAKNEDTKRILICEDEDNIREFVVINLKRAGYEVVETDTGENALFEFENAPPDTFSIALLDIMLPGISGVEVCKSIRAKSDTIGIIMLSAKTQEMDKINCLMIGADDYITKPFSPSELIARADAIHRRVRVATSLGGASLPPADEEIDIISPPFRLDHKNRCILKNDKAIDLTQVEYQILELFMKNPNTALDRKSILDKIWGENYYGDVKIVDVNIRRIRVKIEDDPSEPTHIQTVWGLGYRWNV